MANIGRVVFGMLMGLISLMGLFMAAFSQDSAFYQAGLMFTGFGAVVIFYLISQANYDSDETH